jgi:hypothetical protein
MSVLVSELYCFFLLKFINNFYFLTIAFFSSLNSITYFQLYFDKEKSHVDEVLAELYLKYLYTLLNIQKKKIYCTLHDFFLSLKKIYA